MTVATNRRNRTRNRPPGLVYIELGPHNGGMMRDLSEDGFAMRAMMPLRAGDSTPFSFSLNPATQVEGHCKIMWVKEDGRVAGLRFVEVSPQFRQQIRNWLNGAGTLTEETVTEKTAPANSTPPPASTMDALRDEIRTVAPRGDSGRKRERSPKIEPFAAPVSVEKIPAAATELKREISVHAEAPAVQATAPTMSPAITSESTPAAEPPLLVEDMPANSVVPADPIATPSESATIPAPGPEFANPPAIISADTSAPEPIPFISLPPLEPLTPTPESASGQIFADANPSSTEAAQLSEIIEVAPDSTAAVLEWHREAPALEPLPFWEQRREHRKNNTGSWTDRITISGAIGAMLLLTLVVGAIVYHQEIGELLIWAGQKLASSDAPPPAQPVDATPSSGNATQTPAASTPAQQKPAEKPHHEADSQPLSNGAGETENNSDLPPETENIHPAPAKPAISPNSTPTTAGGPSLSSAANKTTIPSNSLNAPVPGESTPDYGQQDFSQAQAILKNKARELEMPEAVRLLWVAVEKGNTGAEITLADLYRTGRGVTKNCDQTRILLTAAVHKGSAEAEKRLGEFEQAGCQ